MSELRAGASTTASTASATTPATATTTTPATARTYQALVIGVFEDEVRAEQALRALDVWRHANRPMGVGPIGVVARHVSGTVTWHARGVVRGRRGFVIGLLIGLVLFALPAAGAAWLAAWVLGSISFGLAGLIGVVPSDQVGMLVLAAAAGASGLAAVLSGLVGALLGGLVGVLVGLVDGQARGLRREEVSGTAAALAPGEWATVARVRPGAEWLVRDELARLGGEPAEWPQPAAPAAPAEA
ncbi:MAG TPA: hypothetical protein VIC57_05630 [Candidatus Dormibacteraeota bacterium]